MLLHVGNHQQRIVDLFAADLAKETFLGIGDVNDDDEGACSGAAADENLDSGTKLVVDVVAVASGQTDS